MEHQRSYWLSFDESKITFITDNYSSDIKWEYYKYYKENRNSIFLFTESIYDAVACARSEIGDENYESLKAIVTKKITELD